MERQAFNTGLCAADPLFAATVRHLGLVAAGNDVSRELLRCMEFIAMNRSNTRLFLDLFQLQTLVPTSGLSPELRLMSVRVLGLCFWQLLDAQPSLLLTRRAENVLIAMIAMWSRKSRHMSGHAQWVFGLLSVGGANIAADSMALDTRSSPP